MGARGPVKGSRYKERASGLLQDMRWVYANPKKKRGTAGRELCGRIYDKDGQDFLTRLERMEKEYRGRLKGEVVVEELEGGGIGDEGSEKVEALLERLIREARGEVVEGGSDVERG